MSQAGDVSRFMPKLPKQLADGLAAADELRKQIETPPATEPQPGANGAPPAPQQPAPAAAQPPAATPPAQLPPETDETWEQRARSIQGRYDALVTTNRDMSNRLQTLEQTIASLQATPRAEPEPAPIVAPKLVTEQERTDYGDDFLNVVSKRAKETYAPEFEALARRLKQVEGRVEGTVTLVQKSVQQDLYQMLDSKVADWRSINRSDQFKGWLQALDPYSGRRKMDMLQEAFARQEGDRVVRFFEGFLTEATRPPSSQPNPPATPSLPPLAPTGTSAGALTLEQLAAPGRARSAPRSDLPPEKPVYTHAWIATFMADKRRGKFRGREADADAIERDIYQAQHEGRIV